MYSTVHCTVATPEIKRGGCITADFDWYIRSLIHTQLEEWLQVNCIISLTHYQPYAFRNKMSKSSSRIKGRII